MAKMDFGLISFRTVTMHYGIDVFLEFHHLEQSFDDVLTNMMTPVNAANPCPVARDESDTKGVVMLETRDQKKMLLAMVRPFIITLSFFC